MNYKYIINTCYIFSTFFLNYRFRAERKNVLNLQRCVFFFCLPSIFGVETTLRFLRSASLPNKIRNSDREINLVGTFERSKLKIPTIFRKRFLVFFLEILKSFSFHS